MSYRLSKFGTVTLPCARLSGTFGTGPTVDATVATLGGIFDTAGGNEGHLDTPYELTHSIWVVDDEADAQATIEDLYALRGERHILYRTNEVNSALNWCWARCIQVRAPWQIQRKTLQPLDIVFQVQTPWYGNVTGTGWSLDSGETLDAALISGAVTVTLNMAPYLLQLNNAGNVLTRHVSFRLTATSAPISGFEIGVGNCYVQWSGTVAATKVLQVTQRQSYMAITNDSANAYNGFAYGATHNSGWWLELQPGYNTVAVTCYGAADNTITFDHADGWG
jgi:hypothetical protein